MIFRVIVQSRLIFLRCCSSHPRAFGQSGIVQKILIFFHIKILFITKYLNHLRYLLFQCILAISISPDVLAYKLINLQEFQIYLMKNKIMSLNHRCRVMNDIAKCHNSVTLHLPTDKIGDENVQLIDF
jgi:hypothetical protein